MIFGPNFTALFVSLLEMLPLAFLFCMFGFWMANRFVGEPRTTSQNALAVILQWFLVIPLQLILGHQLNTWIPQASEVIWIGMLASAIPIAGILAAYLILRHQLKHCLAVGIIASVISFVASTSLYWALLKYNT